MGALFKAGVLFIMVTVVCMSPRRLGIGLFDGASAGFLWRWEATVFVAVSFFLSTLLFFHV